ncbi:hypothetical protein FF38_00181 [Lucilia cuprina]|uniref:Ionotropic glutamate receptor C-terminal domain-containing protein n=1 Tax=Lucilia cuprina TaxID=7375 RepID=A0A0L0BTP4_LUCCU|nr:hypothetical protein FF38_00181 [Lucilia cuprina]
MLFKEITLVTFLAILAVSTANQAAENGTNILCGTLRVIFVNIFKPKCMSVSVIVNISDHEDFKFSKDILDNVMTINKNIQVPVAINQYTASKLLHLIQAKLIFTNSAENIRNIKLRHSFRKLLQLQWLLLIFILRLSYEGSIFQAIRMSPYQRLPLTIDEVVKQNYSLVTDYAAARILSEMSYLKNITTIVPGNPQSVLESIDDLPPKTGVLSSDIFIALFMKRRLSNYSEYAIVRDKHQL